MASAVLEPSATSTRARSRGWWGNGDAPHRRWPGTTIEIPALWHRGRKRWESHGGRYYYDQGAADRVVSFFPTYLRHHIGADFAGKPFTLLPYQDLLLSRTVFGWKHAETGLRRFRKVFAFCPKASGKSPYGAGVGLYLAFCDQEPGANVYAVAADKKQARTVHDNARYMVETMIEIEPEFRDVLLVKRDAIECELTRSTYEVISADAGTKHGFRPHAVIFDEMHAQKNRLLYEALKKSMVKRLQPLMFIITHAGYDDESICAEEYDYAKAVLSGTIPDESCLPVIFEAQRGDDWADPTVWARVNPGYGVTVKPDGLLQECIEAQNEPRKLNDFKRFHLNCWTNSATAWIPIEWWDACGEPVPSDEALRQCPCAIGIDMAQKIDLSAVVAVFRLPLAASDEPAMVEVVAEDAEPTKRTLNLNYRIAVLPAFWLPEDTIRERVKQDRVPYDQWVHAGLLRQTNGAVIDSDAIVRYVTGELMGRFARVKQAEVAYDPAFATEIGVRLRDGHGMTTLEVLQNYRQLSEACQVFEALVKAGRVLHGGHRVLRWCVENVAVKQDDAGRVRPVKPKRSGKRIDGVVALIMALSRVMVMPAPRPAWNGVASVWTPEGFRPLGGESRRA